MSNKQVKYGAIFSYILIILNATYGLFLTPYIIEQIGEAPYGVYKTISAFTASLMVLDLGLGGTMMRYIAKYRADKEDEKIPNFVCMGAIQAGVVCAVVALVTAVLYFFLDEIYQNGLTAQELVTAKQLYVFLAVGMVTHIVENLLNGIISGYNRFVFANGIA
jgi:O-antigen/teichoic acid export membrane protein